MHGSTFKLKKFLKPEKIQFAKQTFGEAVGGRDEWPGGHRYIFSNASKDVRMVVMDN